jgi:hypothetical protein
MNTRMVAMASCLAAALTNSGCITYSSYAGRAKESSKFHPAEISVDMPYERSIATIQQWVDGCVPHSDPRGGRFSAYSSSTYWRGLSYWFSPGPVSGLEALPSDSRGVAIHRPLWSDRYNFMEIRPEGRGTNLKSWARSESAAMATVRYFSGLILANGVPLCPKP